MLKVQITIDTIEVDLMKVRNDGMYRGRISGATKNRCCPARQTRPNSLRRTLLSSRLPSESR
jgi:hypothetical protein